MFRAESCLVLVGQTPVNAACELRSTTPAVCSLQPLGRGRPAPAGIALDARVSSPPDVKLGPGPGEHGESRGLGCRCDHELGPTA